MHAKKLYFGPGPATLPDEVLHQVAEAVVCDERSGLSILSIPHRGWRFIEILEEANSLVKELCGLSEDWNILWLAGGARLQFAMVPMNFLGNGQTAGYLDSGYWANDALKTAQGFGKVQIVGSSKEDEYRSIPHITSLDPQLAYLHVTTNNTIYGTKLPAIPPPEKINNIPVIADMSSNIFSETLYYGNCTLFYACAQKNLGAAGVTLLALRKDFAAKAAETLTPMLSYKAHIAVNGVLNTPPVFNIYVALLMLRWTKARTLQGIEVENTRKAACLYAEINRNKLFLSNVHPSFRSICNIIFDSISPETSENFKLFATAHNISGIEGHRSVGAFRVSIYNAVTFNDVQKLVEVMKDFETKFYT